MMNIKSVANPVASLDSASSATSKETVKTFESSDRDANGKQEQGSHQEQRKFSEQEIEELLEKIKKLPAVKSAGLIVEKQTTGSGLKFVVKSPDGDVIRRLTPLEAWESTHAVDTDRPKGQLLNKAM